MTTSLQYFMLIAKEQSIVRAAEQLYITPQNLSNHMKRLEKEYGMLFNRYPHFKLTPAGEALLETLQQIDHLEHSLSNRLKELNEEMIGTIHFGIHHIRAYVVLPRVMLRFAKSFPDVHLIFHYQNMDRNVQTLRNGEIDAFFGIDAPALPEFTVIPLTTEPIYFVASVETLKQNGVSPDADLIRPNELSRFVYLLSPKDSIFRPKISSYCDRAGIVLKEVVTISDFNLQLAFASLGLGACFTPETLLSEMRARNITLSPNNRLKALRIEGMASTTSLSFVIYRFTYRSEPIKGLIRTFQEVFAEGFI